MAHVYPPFQQNVTKSAGQVDNPAWRMFFVTLWNAISGAVTHVTGALTLNHLILGNGGDDIKTLASLGTTTTVLHGNAAGAPTFGAVALTTDVSGTLPIANGGTNSSTALSGSTIMISNGTAIVQGAAGTTTTLLHGNAGGAPTYTAVSLTADVTGTLPVANGGTGIASLTVNRVPYGNNTSPFQSASDFTFDGSLFTIPGQIAFPATQFPSSNANTLDDYEEGTWTPVIGGGGGTSGQTYATQIGRYVKVGIIVHCDFRIVFSNKGTITAGVELQGLPFTIENTTGYNPVISIGYWTALATTQVWVSGVGVFNGVTGLIYGATAAATGLTQLTTADITNTTELVGHISYRATA